MVSEPNSPYFREILDGIPVYRPGRTIVSPEGRSYKLSSNESPDAPLPSVRSAIAEAALEVNRYPDNAATELTSVLAARFGVPEEHLALGAGSVGVTQQLLEAVGEPGAEVVYAWRSFEAYPLLAQLAGVTAVQVPLREETHDLEAMLGAITDQTRLVLVCNPNNPTGTAVGGTELIEFLDRVPEHVLVVLDEAYREYVDDPDVVDGLNLYRRRDNIAVLRTFSKAYGLAGLRVGFLVGPPHIAAAIRKTMIPFAVNRLAQAAAVASLNAEDELRDRVAQTVAERDRVYNALRADGWTVPTTRANFVWLRLGKATTDFAEACAATGVAIRPFPGEGARVSIGDPEANDAFLAAAKAFPQRC
ncbi:histidinol-phosphate transaminase [Lipingzhangella sp. LS1_29]|uniref:Aromatic amino acid aminotransferase n=1 Tax=Lipingzhangella rawalii TaxID=2055835 RepID=A0ABU2H870_9ACTN|nr:histidinol-phosphate transaminase [Lipingzhangella rawalii]MDS1271491.1 histidinol-phosphate transaminase [Lipingzhangella rawalii]